MALRRDLRPVVATAVIVLVAVAMRLYHLGMLHERDFDEGVYWESLRLMHAGHGLYSEIYYSQPPLFLVSAYPVFELFGRSIEAARLSCVLFSLAGLAGAYLCGRALAGKWGGVASLALAATSVPYLQMSQTLQAEASAVSMSWLAAGLALAARDAPPRRHTVLAACAGVAVGFAVCCKLLALAALVPIAFALLVTTGGRAASRRGVPVSAAVCCTAFVLTMLVAAVPFAGYGSAVLHQVILLHAGPGSGFGTSFGPNLALLLQSLVSPVTAAALLGLCVAVRYGNPAVIPLGAWFVASAIALALLTPLFPHHTVLLIPPLVALASLAYAQVPGGATVFVSRLKTGSAALGALVVLLGAIGCATYFTRDTRLQAIPDTLAMNDAVSAVRASTAPGSSILGDDDFVAALADRDAPPGLVDTSFARIRAGQLSNENLIRSATGPATAAVLLFTHRLSTIPGLREALAAHDSLRASFGSGRELWVPNHESNVR